MLRLHVGERLAETVDRAGGDSGGLQLGEPLGGGLAADHFAHQPNHLRAVGDPGGVGGDVRLYGPQHYFSLEGYYSTAFDTYWSRARVGMNLGRFIIGPEAGADGNEGYDAQRLGAFAMFKLDMFGTRNPAELTIHGGYQFVDDDNGSSVASTSGGEGAYAGFNLSFAF